MNHRTLIFRHASQQFKSIENVFNTLLPFLKADKLLLPNHSNGILNLIKNIVFLVKRKVHSIHITGHDHYLLWFPFRNVILTIHDIEALKRKRGLKKWLFKKLWFDIPIRNAKAVTTISEFSKKEILSLGDYKTPIKVIYNPLTLPLKYLPKKFHSEETRVLHIGTKLNKNLERTLEALHGLSCHLTIIGTSNSTILAQLEKNKIKYRIKSNLSELEMIEEYINCDIVSFVSIYEGFGLPIIEAQAVGRPVITSNVASMPEIAGGAALLVDPFSVKEIKGGFLKLMNDIEFRESLIAKGLLNVKRFKPSNIALQYSDLYKQFLND